MTVAAVLAGPGSIPSPSSGTLTIGPLSLNAYGLMIAAGVIAAVWLWGRRMADKGIGTSEDAQAIGLWAVVAGVIGSRLYHVVTDWERFEGNYGDIVKIWEGGLGIPGGLLAGTVVGMYVCRQRGIPLGPAANAAAPAAALAQAIGRWGNYFNQELFGRPTDVPWALEIDDANIPAGYAPGTTFHPTFLYESLGNLALAGALIWIDRRSNPAGGRLFAMYVVGYGFIRFWVEGLRIDDADELGPFRWNQWVAIAAVVGGAVYLIATRHKPKYTPAVVAAEAEAGVDADDVVTDADLLDDTMEPVMPADDDGDPPIEDADLVDDDSMWADASTDTRKPSAPEHVSMEPEVERSETEGSSSATTSDPSRSRTGGRDQDEAAGSPDRPPSSS